MHTECGDQPDRKLIRGHLTPFKRGRSKIFYDSHSDHQSGLLSVNDMAPYVPSEYINRAYSASPEIDNNCTDGKTNNTSRTLSPPALIWPDFDSSSFTPLRCSPSQRSQDSGYSDSGESNNGNNNSKSDVQCPPVVKHITKVYFGQGNKSLPNNQLIDINTTNNIKATLSCPPNRSYKVCKRRLNKQSSTKRNHAKNYSNSFMDRPPKEDSVNTKIHSGHNNPLSTEELDEYLEHKTLFGSVASDLPQNKYGVRKLFHSLIPDWKSNSARLSRKFSPSLKLNTSLPVDLSSSSIKCSTERRRWSGAEFNRSSTPLMPNDSNIASSNCLSSKIIPHNSFHSCDAQYHPSELAHTVAKSLRNESLKHWLTELRGSTDTECMNTLQSKTINVSKYHKASQHAIKSIKKHSHAISTQFALVCQKLESTQLEEIPSIVKCLVDYIENFVTLHCPNAINATQTECVISHQVQVLDQICKRLLDICTEAVISGEVSCSSIKTIYENAGDESDDCTLDQEFLREVVQVVTALGHAFTKLVDILICHEVKKIVKRLEDSEGSDALHDAICQITALGVDGGHVCGIVSRMGGMRALLGICVLSKYQKLLSPSLRAVATICCAPEGIIHFKQEGGVEIIAGILGKYSLREEDRSEAAGVLAQVTSPWVEESLNFPSIRNNLQSIVDALNVLTKETSSTDVFLLSAVALANLTFLDQKCVEALINSNSHDMLLRKTKESENLSVYIQDQVATVLANMSSSPGGSKAITEVGGIAVLVDLLNTRPSFSSHLAQLSAVEHVQQKSAIAISRLCSDSRAGRLILKMGGASRLVELCENADQRNGSDAVLVACLAALRKLASSCGAAEVRKVDGAELIEPRLLDSFWTYSSQQENYV